MNETNSLAAAIGQRARAIRLDKGQTLDALATQMRSLGFKWATSRVVELERGKVAPTLGTLLAVCSALTVLDDSSPIELRDLLPQTGHVEISPGVTVTAEQLRRALDGEGILMTSAAQQELTSRQQAIQAEVAHAARLAGPTWSSMRGVELQNRATLADARAASTLGITPAELHIATQALWDDTLSGARDKRSKSGDSPQRLGRITRELLGEVSAYIASVDSEPQPKGAPENG